MKSQWWLRIAFAQSLVATLMSLYYSEIVGLAPCKLCWLQRIFMYPLVILLGMAIQRKDKHIHVYALPFAVIGWVIALYHNIDYFVSNYAAIDGILPSCGGGISCTQIRPVFGFITIPMLSLVAFSVIIGCLWMQKKAAAWKWPWVWPWER